MAMSAEQRKNLATAAWAGVSALVFVTDPARWPGFAAFAEQQMGVEWTDADRLRMKREAQVLLALAETAEAGQ